MFGEVVDGTTRLNELGQIAAEEWLRTGEIRPRIRLDAFVVMPNHIHGIIVIGDRPERDEECAMETGARHEGATCMSPVQSRARGPKSQSVGAIIGTFKAAVSRRIHAISETTGMIVWHRNYYEHIIRNERDWNRIRAYIRENPAEWDRDEENPLRKK